MLQATGDYLFFRVPPADFSPRFEVVSLFAESGSEFLLLQRHPDKHRGGEWCTPGGKKETGESPEDALVREIREETGLDIQSADFKKVATTYQRYPEFDYIFHMYRLKLGSQPKISLNGEHTAWKWASPEEALGMPLVPLGADCIKLVYGLAAK